MTMWELLDEIEIQGCVNIRVWDDAVEGYVLDKDLEKMTEEERLTYFGGDYIVKYIYSEKAAVTTFEIAKRG